MTAVETALTALPFLWQGLLVTIHLSLLSVALSLVAGTLLGLALTFGNRFAYWPIRIFTDVIRGIPILVLLFAVYYLLPLLCGVLLLAASELHRWRAVLLALADRFRLDPGPATPLIAAVLVGFAGVALIAAALPLQGGQAPTTLADLGRLGELAGGVAMLLLAAGFWRQLDGAWRWGLASIGVALVAVAAAGAPAALACYLALLALLLFACRAALPR